MSMLAMTMRLIISLERLITSFRWSSCSLLPLKMSPPLTAAGIPTSLRTARLKLRMLDPDDDKQCNEIISLVNGDYFFG
jgi:hypothetical protein